MEAKHVQILGMRFPLYLYMLDRADWDSGKILFFRDQDAADQFQLPLRKMRDWRRRLEEDGYIECIQKYDHQEIIIKKWVDPREKEPVNPIINEEEGYEKHVPLSYEKPSPLRKMDTEGYVEGGLKTVTLPYIKNTRSKTKEDIQQLDQEFRTLHASLFSNTFNDVWWSEMEKAPKELEGDVLKIKVSNEKIVEEVNARTKPVQKHIANSGLSFKSFVLVGEVGVH